MSRSIVLDPVNERIDQLRFVSHKETIAKISQGELFRTLNFDKKTKDEYLDQIQRAKKSNTYVQGLFDDKVLENSSLVRRMNEI